MEESENKLQNNSAQTCHHLPMYHLAEAGGWGVGRMPWEGMIVFWVNLKEPMHQITAWEETTNPPPQQTPQEHSVFEKCYLSMVTKCSHK
jgi:hypothetical protein